MIVNDDEIDIFGDKKIVNKVISTKNAFIQDEENVIKDKYNTFVNNTMIDNYNKKVENKTNISKDALIKLLNIRKPETSETLKMSEIPENQKSCLIKNEQLQKLDYIIPKNNNEIYINEYWNFNETNNWYLKNKIIPFIECVNIWNKLKVDEKCYFIYTKNLDDTEISEIIRIFDNVGFDYIENNVNDNKIVFKKISVSKIRNWKYLKYIYEYIKEL